MDVSGVVLRQACSISGDLFNDTHSSKSLFSGYSISAGKRVSGDLSFARSRDFLGVSCSGFSDNGHLQYYVSSSRCGVKKEMVKEKKAAKKKLKLVKGLMKNLSAYSEMGFSELVAGDSIGNQKITTELLLAQLEKLKAEEKEMKRKHKEEKAKLKALKMESDESSSSSSESSDSDCGGQVIDMRRKKSSKLDNGSVAEIIEEASSTSLVADEQMVMKFEDQTPLQEMSVTVGATAERIDVCMGGKCKKLGAAALLEEFKSQIGIESAVVGCKCMGKCRSAPNVRVSNLMEEDGGDTSVRAVPAANPLYIGVGLEDVNAIVASFFGKEEEGKELGFMAAT